MTRSPGSNCPNAEEMSFVFVGVSREAVNFSRNVVVAGGGGGGGGGADGGGGGMIVDAAAVGGGIDED